MSVSPSSIVSKIRQEAALFDSKDRLLNIASKSDFQSPLVMEPSDKFWTKWNASKGALPLDTFLPISASFTLQQKLNLVDSMVSVLREKSEDFGCSDLYLVAGFLKWDGNALAPSLLVPVEADISKKTLSLSARTPIENVILRERLKDKVALPKAEDALVNGQFDISLYFTLFEKAIATEKNWKFTRNGLCLSFFNTSDILLKKRMSLGWNERKIDSNPTLSSLLSEDGFEVLESQFEDSAYDHVFSPADHHFLYQTDSHTTKVTIDAQNDRACAYAIQALPGTAKMKVVTNLLADAIAQKKKVLVVSRRAVSASSFKNTWKPPFRTFPAVDRDALEQEIRKSRQEILKYYDTVNKPIAPTGVLLSDLLREFQTAKPSKHKFPESVYQGVSSLGYPDYLSVKQELQDIVDLYFSKNGFEALKTFQGVTVSSLSPDAKNALAEDLRQASDGMTELDSVTTTLDAAGLLPTGASLSGIAEILQLIKDKISPDSPTFEQWQLRESHWESYKDTLLTLAKDCEKWLNFRKQPSEVYVDNAEDANILSAREDFAESQKITLKGLSDRYRNSRKRLMTVIRNPKSITSDQQLLEQIDALLDLQDSKKAYKESSVLCNHLLGKDWLYERSDWETLDQKIQFVYNFREKYKKNPKFDLLLQILEQWHALKDLLPDFEKIFSSVSRIQGILQRISKNLELDEPLDSQDIDKWLNKVVSWIENWDNLDIHLQLASLFKKLDGYNCPGLAAFVQNPSAVHKDIAQAVGHYWTGKQLQSATKACPDIFSTSPKARFLKNRAYRELLEKYCNSNFRDLHDSVASDPDLLTSLNLNESFSLGDEAHFDLAIILDADCISVAEAIPSILCSDKVILIGDPHNPNLERLPRDAYQETELHHTTAFQESILATALRQGIPTRELWFSTLYSDANIVGFANARVYNNGIRQLPAPSKLEFKGLHIKTVQDKILAVAQAAIRHAEKHPSQTLGIIAFHQSTCQEIEATIRAMLMAGTPEARFFDQPNQDIRYYVKTPERAVDRFRDVILVCAEADCASHASDRKISLCTTLAKAETRVFISESDFAKQNSTKSSLFWEWISYLQAKDFSGNFDGHSADSPIKQQIIDVLTQESFTVEETFNRGGIPIGPAIVDANNDKRFLAIVEDDCSCGRFRDSVEDRVCIRPQLLKQLGWKVLHVWLPFWFMTNSDEIGHLVATLAIEQSVAPPPQAETVEDDEGEDSETTDSQVATGPAVVPYMTQHPKIEGTAHDKPIAELPAAALITQLKFYVDREAPIHEEILKLRVLELHHVDRAGPVLQRALTEAINQGLQKKRFVKTGPFFYSLTQSEVVPRNRSARPDFERKLTFVPPEERALMPQSMSEYDIKQALGLLE